MLCVAVMLSVMVLGAGAAFSDQDQIENTEAVDATTALNIISGYEDGSFHPERNIKRSEMCKMICIALNGGKEPATSTKDDPTFTDIDGHWAEGYIEYCYAKGVVSGVGGGRFNPDGNVTVTQAAKMLLVALGYNADVELFNGENWSLYVNVKANQDGIYEGLEAIDTAAALTRDQAAQMIWNTMQAVIIVKTSSIDVTTGNVTETYSKDEDNTTLLNDKYKTNINVGTLISVDGKNLEIQMSDADKVDSDKKDVTEFMDVSVDYSALLGQKVKVMFTKTNDVQGVFATDENTVYTVNANAVDQDGAKIKFNDKSYSVELKGLDNGPGDGTTALVSYRDGERINGYTVAELAAMDTSASVLTLIDSDSNGKIDTVMEKTYTVAKVTYAASSQIVAGGNTYKYADENIAEGLAKDDWVVITENLYDECKDIAKADMIETTIQGYKVNGGDADDPAQYKIDGTWYNTYNGAKLDADAGDTADVVVVNGIVFYADKVSGTADSLDVALVVETGSFNQAKLAFADGTTKTVTIDTDGVAPEAGKVFCYEVDGEEYKLLDLATEFDNDDYTLIAEANDTINEGSTTTEVGTSDPSKAGNVGGTAIDDNAKVVLYANNSGVRSSKLITGKQFKTIDWNPLSNNSSDALAAMTSTVAGIKKVSVLFVNIGDDMPDTFESNTNYAYVVEDSYTYSSDYMAYSIFDGSETIEVREKNASTRSVGDIIGYESIEDGVIKDVTLYNSTKYTTAALIGIDDDGMGFTIDGTNHLNVTADTKIILINSDDNGDQVGVPGDALSTDYEADEIGNNGVYVPNAKIISADGFGDDADVDVVVVDVVNNKMAGAAVEVGGATPSAAAVDAALEAAEAGETVVVKGAIQAGTVNVPANVTLQINKMAAANAVLNVAKGAEVIFENGKKLSDLATASNTLTLTANSSGGWKITAAAGTTLTVKAEMGVGKETQNFYTAANIGAVSSAIADTIPAKTFTYTTGMGSGNNIEGWFAPNT